MAKFYAILHNNFNVANAAKLVNFYTQKIGMSVLQQHKVDLNKEVFVVGFNELNTKLQGSTALELVCSPDITKPGQKQGSDGYWKIGIGLPDVATTTALLRKNGVQVSDPEQFRDIGYMCHLSDPEHNGMELLQHTFEDNFKAVPAAGTPLGAENPVVGQITIRTKDPEKSLSFYRDVLGMKYLSRQAVTPYGFTLYFLAFTEEEPPVLNDLDAVGNREWLWQRPYTTLEMQHRHGTENQPDFLYGKSEENETGWQGMTVTCSDLDKALTLLREKSVVVLHEPSEDAVHKKRMAVVADPDGYRIKLLEA